MSNEIEHRQAWFAGRLPDDWFEGPPDITADRDEILVVGTISDVELEAGAAEDARAAARRARIARFRKETHDQRIHIANEAEAAFGQKIAGGVRCGDLKHIFTHLSIPVMTRLRITERRVLDTLVDARVARTRSEALAWCVRLVARNQTEWLEELRRAFQEVEKVRSGGPAL